MKEFCIHCGAELREDAQFCTKCGKPVQKFAEQPQAAPAQPAAAEIESPGAAPAAKPFRGKPRADVPARKGKKGAVLEKLRAFTEQYVLGGIAMLACLVVFISGFFINISFAPMEQVQAKITLDSIVSIGNVDTALSTTTFEQNVFNVFGALAVPVGGDEEESERITNILLARVTDAVAKYDDELVEVTLLAAQGEQERAAELMAGVMMRMLEDVSRSAADVNLIKLDRLEAESAYGNAITGTESTAGISENVIKRADDTVARTAVMVGYPIGVIYLQVVSLVFLILTAIGMFSGNGKLRAGKFFTLYLIGFVFLFFIAQASATTIGGAGMFCFIFAAVMLLLYSAGRVFATRGMNAEKIVAVSASGVAAVLSFAALCMLFGAAFEFGGLIDKVGSVFGLYAFDNASLEAGEGAYITASGFAGFGCVYLAILVLTSLVFFFSVSRLNKGSRGKAGDIVLSSIALAVTLISYLVLYILTETASGDLLSAPVAFLIAGVLLLCVLAAWIIGGAMGRAIARRAQSAYGAPAAYPYYPNYYPGNSAAYAPAQAAAAAPQPGVSAEGMPNVTPAAAAPAAESTPEENAADANQGSGAEGEDSSKEEHN